MAAKARVDPLIPITIPRLELLAAVKGARVACSTLSSMVRSKENVFFWSDSTTVIFWIQMLYVILNP